MTKKTYQDLKKRLYEVPGTREHMNKFSVLMAREILKRRKELGLTQVQVIERIKEQGHLITQATLSRVECGDDNIQATTYDKVLHALGDLEAVVPHYSERPKSRELVTN